MTHSAPKAVVCYDLNRNPICEYSSITEAANAVNGTISGISRCVNEKRSHYLGYVWSFKGNSPQQIKYKVYSYDSFGNYKEWISIKSIMKEMNIERDKISYSLKTPASKKSFVKGHCFFYMKDGVVKYNDIVSFSQKGQPSLNRMSLYGYNPNGEVRYWDSQVHAAKELNCTQVNVSQSVRSKPNRKYACKGWYIFNQKEKVNFKDFTPARLS
jgi:hypothetical protein